MRRIGVAVVLAFGFALVPVESETQQPGKVYFELAVNMNTAKALGLTIPQSLLLRATEVIQ